jgi:hypothetical protein
LLFNLSNIYGPHNNGLENHNKRSTFWTIFILDCLFLFKIYFLFYYYYYKFFILLIVFFYFVILHAASRLDDDVASPRLRKLLTSSIWECHLMLLRIRMRVMEAHITCGPILVLLLLCCFMNYIVKYFNLDLLGYLISLIWFKFLNIYTFSANK